MGNCLDLLLHPDRSSGTSRWWAAPGAPLPPSQWSNLAPEVATKVLHHLPAGGADHVRFAAVCTQWRAAAQQASLLLPLPLLALPDGTAYSLLDGKSFPFRRCMGYVGVSGHWLVFSRDEENGTSSELFLVDPFSDATMSLPALTRVRVRHGRDDVPSFARMEMVMRRVICCSPPHFIAALVRIGDHCTGIAVCQPDVASWWSVHVDERFLGFDDYAIHQGNLYAVDYPGGGLFSIDIGVDQDTGDPFVSQIQEVVGGTTDTTFRGDDYLGEMLYLVESCGGELLMVRRIINGQWIPPSSENAAAHNAARWNQFQVFKADIERSRWTEERTIGADQVLFLRQRCSKSVCVSQCEMPGEQIFFLQNVDEDQTWFSEESPSCCSVYDLTKGIATTALPGEVSWRPGTVATWLFPKD